MCRSDMRGNHNTVNAVHVNPHQTSGERGGRGKNCESEVLRLRVHTHVCELMCLASKRMDDGSYNNNVLVQGNPKMFFCCSLAMSYRIEI